MAIDSRVHTGPAASFEPLSGGNGINLMVSGPPRDLAAAGYVEEEYRASGVATSYVEDGENGSDGRWQLKVDAEAPFTTRLVVRRPADPARANGCVVVEWFNVTAGFDVPANHSHTADEILRGGYVYVGVSAQALGIEGGEPAIGIDMAPPAVGIKGSDPERYGSLVHPGDQFSYDVFTQVARGLLVPGAAPLGGIVPDRILAVGESQSAFRLVTYVNAFHDDADVFDGFCIHSRGRAAARLAEGGPVEEALSGPPVFVRDDGDTPVLIVQAEGDLVGRLDYAPARQPDTDTVRLWEMAGTAHADRYSAGDIGAFLGCPAPINDGPAHFLLKSSLRHLDRWVTSGEAPPPAPRIEMADGAVVRDELGNALGGIRTPVVDVPAATLAGDPVGDLLICQLFGSTTIFPPEQLVELYGTRDAYLERFDASLDEAVATGWVLPEDRDEMAAIARATAFA